MFCPSTFTNSAKASLACKLFASYAVVFELLDVFIILLLHGQARQSLIVRGLFPMLADPRHPVSISFPLRSNLTFVGQ